MKREKELALLEASLKLSREKRVPLDQQETLIPVANYIEPQRFQKEMALFRRSLNVVALSAQIANPGDFLTTEISETPVLVARADDGELRAFLNVCRHRGARVELKPRGHCKNFVCPYHAWTYNNDGRLNQVRHRDGFPTLNENQASLVPLTCLERGGLVWVCPDPKLKHEELDEAGLELCEELEQMLGPKPTWVASQVKDWRANWKLIVDGSLESYHFRVAHRDTIAKFFGDTDSNYEFIGDHIRSVLPRRSILEIEEQPKSRWRLRDHANVLYNVMPNVIFLVQKSHFDLVRFEPRTIDCTRIEVATFGRPPGPEGYSAQAREFLEQNHEFTVKTLKEDFDIAEQIQAGLGTGANTHFRFARFEGALTEWHQVLDSKISE